MFLKGNTGTDYTNDKKKSVLDSTPAILLEQFTTFDDNKNNNRESVNMLKERQKITKSNPENDVDNFAKNLDHTLFKPGNLTLYRNHNKYLFNLSIFFPKNPRTKLASDTFILSVGRES